MKIVGLNTVFTDKVKSFIKGTPMAKVYCKDCRYSTKLFTKKLWCLKSRIFNNENKAVSNCDNVNANNDCKDFKRKWWKIWIR